jgi:hypothetical protein
MLRRRLLGRLAKSIVDKLPPVARKLEVCSPLSGVEAQVRECINSQARMEGAGAEHERDQRGNQPNENVQPLRQSILYTGKDVNSNKNTSNPKGKLTLDPQ